MKKITAFLPFFTLILLLTACGRGNKSEIPAKQEKKALTVTELSSGQFYSRSGEFFIALPAGTAHFDISKDFSEATPDRVISFLTSIDDSLIPTIYSDDVLAFYTKESLPEKFVMERYRDNGYTIGLYGLKESSAGVTAALSDNTYIKYSEFESSVSEKIKVSPETVFLISSIGGREISEGDLSPCGSIEGLKKDSSYKVDLYVGTNHLDLSLTPDSHIFSSMEIFETDSFSMDPEGYAVIDIPDELMSGYYLINGTGMFRYINHLRAEGDLNTDVNVPYYYTDEDGSIITYPEWFEKYGSNDLYHPISIEEEFNSSHESLTFKISFPDLPESDILSAPLITVTDPDGKEEQVEIIKNETGNIGTITLAPAIAGKWILNLYHLEGVSYALSVTALDKEPDSILLSGSDTEGSLKVYMSASDADEIFTVRWANTDRAANIELKSPTGVEYSTAKTPDAILDETYGLCSFLIHPEEGEWTLTVSGDDLGRVTYQKEPKAYPEETQSIEEEKEIEEEE